MNFILDFLNKVKAVVDDHCFLLLIPDENCLRLRLVWWVGKDQRTFEYIVSQEELDGLVQWDHILTHLYQVVKRDIVSAEEDK